MPLAALLLLAAASPALASCPAGWLVELSTGLRKTSHYPENYEQ